MDIKKRYKIVLGLVGCLGLMCVGISMRSPGHDERIQQDKCESDDNIAKYSDIEYTSVKGKIQITYLETKDNVLEFPDEIDGKPVCFIGRPDAPGDCRYADKHYDEIILPESVEVIYAGTFQKANTDKVTIKNKAIDIESSAFAYSSVKEVSVPEDFQGTLGTACFAHSALTQFTWPMKSSKDRIGMAVFQGCEKLKKVSFPDSQELIYIPEFTFIGCQSLTKLVFPASTQKVKYLSNSYADNFPEGGVKTLVFFGKDTELDAYPNARGTGKKEFIMAGEILAPKDSKAIDYAKRAVKVKKLSSSYRAQLQRGVSEDEAPCINYSAREYEKNVELTDLAFKCMEEDVER